MLYEAIQLLQNYQTRVEQMSSNSKSEKAEDSTGDTLYTIFI